MKIESSWWQTAVRSPCASSAPAASSESPPSRLPRRTTPARCTPALQTRRSRSRATSSPQKHIRAARRPALTRSIPATASWRRTPTSPRRCSAAGLTWVGPPAERASAGRRQARGEADRRSRPEFLSCRPARPAEIGFPLLVKAARRRRRARDADRARAGRARRSARGGRGARRRPPSATGRSSASATSSGPRHVEIQLLADAARDRAGARRARLLGAAPPPEGARGVAVARARSGTASGDERRRGRVRDARSATRAPAPPSSCSTAATSSSSS